MYAIENLEYINQTIKIQGYYTKADVIIKIYSGKKSILSEKQNMFRPDIKPSFDEYDESKQYGFKFSINCKKPKFKILIIDGSQKITLYKTNNYYIRRRLSNIKKTIMYILHGIKILWKEYHFIVPMFKLKEFAKIFYYKVVKGKLTNDIYYHPLNIDDYNKWLNENVKYCKYQKLSYQPKISIVIPVYNVKSYLLEECIESVLNQSYQNFEICIADDASTNIETIETLKKYEQKYKEKIKIVYRKKNGHISEASNSAIEIATGEFIGLLDNDDILEWDALYKVVEVLNKDKNIDFIYSDEDKINLSGKRCDPHFKADFSIDTLYSHNYICHFAVLRTSIVNKVGGFRKGYEGAQDYDLFLRVVEKTNKIYHIPEILYHWRMVEGSTSLEVDNKSYASINGKKALEDMLKRRKIAGKVTNINTSYIIEYKIKKEPLVSIIIPTRDHVKILKNCIESIINKTTYKNYEIIIVNNGSKEQDTLKYFEELSKMYNYVKILDEDVPFNYSYLNNKGVEFSSGEYVILLNNDIEIITKNWIEIMLGYAMQDYIGAVGPKLLFGNGKIQHAGVVLGVGTNQIANHAFYLEDKSAPALAGRLIVPYNYSAVTGACLMVRKQKYIQVKGLDEQLLVNYNDIDFCIKLLEEDYHNVFLPQVELFHLESISRGKINDEKKQKQYDFEKNYIEKKWGKKLKKDKFYNPNFSIHKCFMLDKKNETYDHLN